MEGGLDRETATPVGRAPPERSSAGESGAAAVLALQRNAGNAAVSQLLQRMVVNADPGDKVIDDAVQKLVGRPFSQDLPHGKVAAPGRTPGAPHGDVVKWKNANFSHLAHSTEPIIIVGHGAETLTEGMVRARRFGDLKPGEIVDGLIEKGLPLSYEGLIYLDGCYTGAGDVKNFADRVARGLREAGYLLVTVKGNLGAASTEAQGVESVQFAEHERAFAELKKTKRYKRFKKDRDKYQKRLAQIDTEVGKIMSKGGQTAADRQVRMDLAKKRSDLETDFKNKWAQAYRDEVKTIENLEQVRFHDLVSVMHPERVGWKTSPLYKPNA